MLCLPHLDFENEHPLCACAETHAHSGGDLPLLTFVASALAPYAAQALSGYCHQCQLGFFVVIIKLAWNSCSGGQASRSSDVLCMDASCRNVASQHATISAKAHHLLCEMYTCLAD